MKMKRKKILCCEEEAVEKNSKLFHIPTEEISCSDGELSEQLMWSTQVMPTGMTCLLHQLQQTYFLSWNEVQETRLFLERLVEDVEEDVEDEE